MKPFPILVAGLAYFALGGLWFTPLFGRQWDRAVGFARPPRWRPGPAYYLGPLAGCLAVAAAMAYLLRLLPPAAGWDAVLPMGAVVGLGVAAAVTGVNAIAPNMPRPGLYTAVVGSYHALGAVLCAAVLHAMRG